MNKFGAASFQLKYGVNSIIGLPLQTAWQSITHLFPFVLSTRSMSQNQPAVEFPLKQKIFLPEKNSIQVHSRTKPPNIYCKLSSIFSPVETSAREGYLLQRIRASVDPCVYTIYNLSADDFSNNVWQASTEILVLCETSIEHKKGENEKISEYLHSGGKVLFILNSGVSNPCFSADHLTIGNLFDRVRAHNFDKLPLSSGSGQWNWGVVNVSEAKPLLALSKKNKIASPSLVVIKMDELEQFPFRLAFALKTLGALPPSVFSETGDFVIPRTSPFFSYASDEIDEMKQLDLKKLLQSPEQEYTVSRSLTSLPIGFHWEDYLSRLSTNVIGKSPVWADVLPSSYRTCQSILSHLSKDSGLMLVSSIQTAGVGRRNNQWISPRGMACFSFHLSLPFSRQNKISTSHLLSWLQHLASLAVLMSLRQLIAESVGLDWRKESCNEQEALCIVKLPGPQILIKWPNDVYAVESPSPLRDGDSLFSKLCGILANASSSNATEFSCLFGIGINVSNQKPTVCLHDVIRLVANEAGTGHMKTDQLPSTAAVIACTLNHLEKLVILFETESGLKTITRMYTSCWTHSNQKVRTLKTVSGEAGDELTIVGVDEFGYLLVEDGLGTSKVLHPNGNSIDMLAGLIIPRQP